jgi:hypothetical protein
MKIRLVLAFCFIIALACKEEFLIDTKNMEPLLVVDGLISTEDGPYTIKVSLTSPINEFDEVPYQGCIVDIYENGLKAETLTETLPGVYKTSVGGLKGAVGCNYYISIRTPDNKEYISDEQEITEIIDIDSIYAEIANLKVDYYPYDLPGFQFYVDTKMASTQETFFLWHLTETYEYTADYHLYAIFDGKMHYDVAENDKYFRCWKTQTINNVFTGKMSNLTSPQIFNQPLQFVGTDSKRLQLKYSFLLKQYCINKDAFYYWKNIENMYSDNNFLITVQPFNIQGNIKNIDNNNEQVFGYFTVASVNEQRIFVSRPQIDFYYDRCLPFDASKAISEWESGDPDLLIVHGTNGDGSVARGCIDCREEGSTLIEPNFWDEW